MWLNVFLRDQLYFDRIHQSLPILHQKRYFSWSKSNNKSATRRCLQYAMWTIASLLSAHSSHMAEPLYRETKQMLESLTTNEPRSANTELAQAWVLVVTFESMRTYHHQAWLSAGRAFRLVQGMRYHSLDRPIDNHCPSALCDDLIEIEERRRVFWMAYFLDHVISMRDNWPITLNEHVVRDCIRVPSAQKFLANCSILSTGRSARVFQVQMRHSKQVSAMWDPSYLKP